jgi:2-hydroxychromene-2-carboxylate isomerase
MPSIKTLLMPAVSQRLLSRERLLALRAKAEKVRAAQDLRHVVHYFHQVDDPYSALAAACLPHLAARYDVDIQAHVAGPPPDNAAPERARLIAYSRKDAALLARHYQLDFTDTGTQPGPDLTSDASRLLVAAIQAGRFVEVAGAVSTALWSSTERLSETSWPGGPLAMADDAATRTHRAAADRLRQQLGHYLGAMFYYAGEWYWGIDRLYHLEQRLQQLGVQKAGARSVLFAPGTDWTTPVRVARSQPIDFFVSLRSPYSAIVAPRIFTLGRLAGVPVRLRYVLPMVMRGLPVPREKRSYITLDAAREAHARGIPFGRLNDPVGRPTERGLALIPLAERAGLGEGYLLSFMRGVWAEGIDAGSDRGLRRIAERAGLTWAACRTALNNDGWRGVAEHNREAMFALGLWGVPSFQVGDVAVWGQDRLWAVQDALMAAPGDPPQATKGAGT